MANKRDIQRVAKQFGFKAVAFIDEAEDEGEEAIFGECFNDWLSFNFRILQDGSVQCAGVHIAEEHMDEDEYTDFDVLTTYARQFAKAAALQQKLAQFNVQDFE